MTDNELRRLALEYVAGRVYTTQDVPQNLWRLVFIPLFFSTKSQLRGVRMVLGHSGQHKTTGQAVNGYPIFMECQMLKRRNLGKFVDYVEAARKLTSEFINVTT